MNYDKYKELVELSHCESDGVSQSLKNHYGDVVYHEPRAGIDGGYEVVPSDSPRIKEIEEYNRKLHPALYTQLDKERKDC